MQWIGFTDEELAALSAGNPKPSLCGRLPIEPAPEFEADMIYVLQDREAASASLRIEIRCRPEDVVKIPTEKDWITIDLGKGLIIDCKLAESPRDISPGIIALVIEITSVRPPMVVIERVADSHDEWRAANE